MLNEVTSTNGAFFSKKSTFFAGFILAVVSGAAAWILSGQSAEQRRAETISTYEEKAAAWLDASVDAVGLWDREMTEQRLRLSESETYRLCASDLTNLRREQPDAVLNDEEGGHGTVVDAVPLIRGMLREFKTDTGLADIRITDAGGETLLSAETRPVPLSGTAVEGAVKAVRDNESVYMTVHDFNGALVLDAADPMLDLSEDEKPIAALVTSTPAVGHISRILARPRSEGLGGAYLLQKNGANWENVRMPAVSVIEGELADTLTQSGGTLTFGLRTSASGQEQVWSSGRYIPKFNWCIVHEYAVPEIEEAIHKALLPVYLFSFAAWTGFMLFMMLLWWISFGRHQKAAANELRRLNRIIYRQKELLHGVNVSLDVGLFMADLKGKIHVCNRAFAGFFGRSEELVLDHMLITLLPPDKAEELMAHIRQTASSQVSDTYEMTLAVKGDERLFRMTLFPFDESSADLRDGLHGAVITMQDITEFRRRSLRRQKQQNALIEAFIRTEESVDPHLHGHSAAMSALGASLCDYLQSDEEQKNTITLSASLSQLGKLFIPRELLLKTGRLTADEFAELRKAPQYAYDLLKDIDFDVPVPQTILHMGEHMDGTGIPDGLSGESIPFASRLLAVINSYCAITKPRSYRDGLSSDKAIEIMRGDSRLDKSIVDALAAMLESQQDGQSK